MNRSANKLRGTKTTAVNTTTIITITTENLFQTKFNCYVFIEIFGIEIKLINLINQG